METTGFAAGPLRVERLDRRGEGRAGALRLPFTLPGELVRGAEVGGVVAPVEVLEPAPERVAPPCRHFGACGGCALQHGSDAFVAGWKREVVVEALARRGIEAEVSPPLVSPPRSRRRATLAARRTRSGAILGFHGRRSEAIVEVTDCLVARPEILAARPALAALASAGGTRSKPLRLTVTHGEAGLDVAAEGGRPADPALRQRLAALAEEADLARLAWEGETVAARRPAFLRMGRARVVPPPGAFLQATAEGEAALRGAAAEAVGDARRVADLFSGVGAFALPLAERAEVHAVEGSAPMLAALDAGWRGAPGLRRVTTEARDLFRRPLGPGELARFDAVVIDPPRAGAEAQARALAASRVPVVAAISCDPVTFARDAAILIAGGYRMGRVMVVDQFRWSPHVELVARFSR